jgi:uncharacterized protein YxeA
MKKAIVIIFVVLAIIVALIVIGNIALDSFRAFLMGEPDIIQEVVSPDGKYVAYVFEANGGATTRFTYRLSVLKEGKKLKAGDVGNAFITYDEFDVEWIDDNTLKVNNIQSINIFKQKMKIDRVNVTYNYIKE